MAAVARAGEPRSRSPAAEPPILPSDILAILYTSGTTGPAKGVLCPHAQYHWWGVHSAEILGVGAGDVLCTTLPLFHINALNTFAQASLAGARVASSRASRPRRFWPTMRAREASVVYLLGAMVPILLAQPAIGGGARRTACASASARACRRAPRRRSASAPACRCSKATARPRPTSSSPARPTGRAPAAWAGCGRASRPASSTRTTSSCRRARPASCCCAPTSRFAFASGYFGKPEATVAAWRNLWFHTGDRVVREADGAFRFVDRIKDAIRRRGENISSYEVEQVLQSHPAVAAVAVYPVRSELAEDEVMAALVARDGRGARPGRAGRLLPHAAAVLRDPALRRGRRRPAAHRERQGAEVQAARARRDAGRVGPAGRGRGRALTMAEYWNAELETQPWREVERWQAEQVTAMLPALRRRSRLYARLHAGVPEDLAVRSAADLAALPFTLKDDLRAAQDAASDDQPFGANQAAAAGRHRPGDLVVGHDRPAALLRADRERRGDDRRRRRQRLVHRRHPPGRRRRPPGRPADGRRRPALCRRLSPHRRDPVLARRLSDRADPARDAPPARHGAAGDDLVRAPSRRAVGRGRPRDRHRLAPHAR